MRNIGTRTLLFLALWVSFVGSWAQTPQLRLASGTVSLPAGIAAMQEGDLVDGRYFRVLQFQGPVSAAAKAQVEARGITLLEYFPENAFLAAIPQEMDPAGFATMGIRSVHRLTTSQKMRRSLQELPLPVWAVPAPGMLDLELNHPATIGQEWVKAKVLDMGFQLLPSMYAGVVSLRIPAHRLEELADQPWVSFLEPINPQPQSENYTGRTLHRSNVIASDHALGRHYDGTGVVVAMGDDGIIGPHIDHQGRADQSRVTADAGTHGDHVAGTIFGAGNLNPKNKGMAFGATLHVYQVWNAVNDGAFANANFGTLITSTSYSDGCNAGYTSFARSMDQMTRQTPTLLHVFSAGNEGTVDCGYGAGAGWGNVTGGVKIGKNVLTVASLSANGFIESYSSRGPTEDGRLKPEVSSKGGNVTSTYPDNTYETISGTSMACPGVSGTIAQLAQAYRELNGNQDPPSALLKAVLMNGCDDRGNVGPDFKYGFGEINALRSVQALENQTYFADTLSANQADTLTITVPAGTAQLKVMLYYHDFEANVNASIPLVNNLDLKVIDPSNQSYLPWRLNSAANATSLNALAVRGRDSLNNVEQVTVDVPAAGTYQVIVNAYNMPMGPQGYHLVYEIRDSAITVTYPMGGEGFAPGEIEKIRWDAEGNTGNFSVEYSTNSGSTWTVANGNVAAATRFLDWQVPTSMQTGHLRFRVSRGSVSGESQFDASVIKVPTGLTVTSACPTYCVLRWDSLATASGYDVFMLGNKYMDSIGTTTSRSFQVNGTNPNQSYWFAVRARAADGARGRRTIALFKSAGVWSCLEPNDVAVSAVTGPGEGVIQSCALGNTMTIVVNLTNYSPNTVTNVPVSFQLDNGAVVTETFTGSLPGNSSQPYTFNTTLPAPNTGTHTIKSWTAFAPDAYTANDSAEIKIEMIPGTSMPLPYAENFETFGLCSTNQVCQNANCVLSNGWVQGSNLVTDKTEWRTDRGGTPTANTGPTTDHNPGTPLGQYLYVEATNCLESTAMVYTPCLNLNALSQPYFSFWHHKLGADMGDLHVDIFANGRWNLDVTTPLLGNFGMNWWGRQIDLVNYAGQTVALRFRGITGMGELSDMAIDDVQVTNGPPVGVQAGFAENGLQVYPNPGTGVFAFSLAQPAQGSIRLTIMDITGRLVIQDNLANFTQGNFHGSFDISDQPSGVYFLQIEAEGQKFGKRIALTR